MEQFGGQSFLSSNYGRVDDEEMIPPVHGISQGVMITMAWEPMVANSFTNGFRSNSFALTASNLGFKAPKNDISILEDSCAKLAISQGYDSSDSLPPGHFLLKLFRRIWLEIPLD
ncbi:hypothetical protein TNCV_531351 [Trichonephila clavipes]|nr:hypothetical protein TNCV_531351 [Trichonephila clavipes]